MMRPWIRLVSQPSVEPVSCSRVMNATPPSRGEYAIQSAFNNPSPTVLELLAAFRQYVRISFNGHCDKLVLDVLEVLYSYNSRFFHSRVLEVVLSMFLRTPEDGRSQAGSSLSSLRDHARSKSIEHAMPGVGLERVARRYCVRSNVGTVALSLSLHLLNQTCWILSWPRLSGQR